MLIIEFIRYLFGYINFKASGGFADRFINLCTKDEIPLWNIRNINGNITASTTIEGYLNIRSAARKSGMRIRVTEKKGLKFFLKRNKVRTGLFLGFAVSVVIVTVLSQFVWSVSLVGNVTLDDDYLLEAFEKYGVCVGSRISAVDTELATQSVMSEIQKLSWAAVNLKGSVMVIEVREKTDAPEIYDDETPTNLVAGEDGVILSVDVLYGNEEVKPGSAVVKGDLLISGLISHPDGSESVIHADGYVKALVKKNKTFSYADFSLCSQVVEKTRKKLFFFGLQIPLGTKVPEATFTQHKSFLKNDEMLLPLGIITEYGASFGEEAITPNESLSNKLSLLSNAIYVKNLLDSSHIVNCHLSESNGEFGKNYEFYAECEQEIGTLQEIYVEKTNDIA